MLAPFKHKPAWLREALWLSTGLGEPPHFLKYRGGQSDAVEAEYEAACSEESLDRLTAAGANLLFLPFFSGFGLEFERAGMERARETAARARRRGLRVAARVTLGALVPETLLAEEPEAAHWLQVNPDGQTPGVPGAGPSFRARPCYSSEGYLRYMEKVCGCALEAGADAVCFDDLGYNPEPDTCRCPVCLVAFREMLRERYGPQEESTRAAGQARFGHHAFQQARPPLFPRLGARGEAFPLLSPHAQEWVAFKSRTLTNGLERLARFIARKNPACAAGARFSEAWHEAADGLHGVNALAQLPLLDFVLQDEPLAAGTSGLEGLCVEHVHGLKTACAFDLVLQTPLKACTPAQSERSLATALVYNGQGAAFCGINPPDSRTLAKHAASVPPQLALAHCAFFRQHREELFQGARPFPYLAVCVDSPSLACHGPASRRALLQVELALLESNLPYDLVYPESLGALDRYRAVLLPNAACLNDEAAQALKAYVAAGGGLVATAETGRFDAWHRVRPRCALAELFGSGYPAAVRVNFGSGRAAYVPGPDAGIESSSRTEEHGLLPAQEASRADGAGLWEAVAFAAGEPPWKISVATGQVLAEGFRTPSGAVAVHVMNTDSATPARELAIQIFLEAAPREVRALAPSQSYPPVPFTYVAAKKTVEFRFETLLSYVCFHVV